jgi:hypothetical protein
MSKYEIPAYKVIKSFKNIEIRQYPSYFIAEVINNKNRNKAANEAFMTLFNYINGNNSTNERIPMTIPVEQTRQKDHWKLSFITPSKYTLENIPKPEDEKIKIRKQEKSKRLVIRFSGLISDSNLNKNKQKLDDYVKENKIKVKSKAIYAFYNAPFTLPFLRRNEIMYIID